MVTTPATFEEPMAEPPVERPSIHSFLQSTRTTLSAIPYKISIYPGPIILNINVVVENAHYMDFDNTTQLTIKYYPGLDACIIQNIDYRTPLSQFRTYVFGILKFATKTFPSIRHITVSTLP